MELPQELLEFKWELWKPKDLAVLCFIQRDAEVLLITKKRGLGKGKVNGPGGRLEPGETAFDAAVRESEEEVGLTPLQPRERGQLWFVFRDGYSLYVTVFTARAHRGDLHATPEADPFWCPVSHIPYEKMWADDRLWLPAVLSGKHIRGKFLFDDDTMLTQEVEESDSQFPPRVHPQL